MGLPEPRSLSEFHRAFPSEEACVRYLFSLRWPGGDPCPKGCGKEYALYQDGRVVFCKTCRSTVSLTAGTIFHGSKVSLMNWFQAIFLQTTLTPGIASLQLSEQLGVSLESAWLMLHKIRSAMVNPERDKLSGYIEADETFLGGKYSGGKRGRGAEGKVVILGAVEVVESNGKRGAKRLRLRASLAAGRKDINQFFSDHVTRGSRIRTDGWSGYADLSSNGYKHEYLTVGTGEDAGRAMPVIHREFSNLKTWILGTHHGAIATQHLQAYLNEFCFRHNRRFWKFNAFRRVMEIGIGKLPPTAEELYEATEQGKLGGNVHVNPDEF